MFALIGETLRRIRKERGKTLEELGKDAALGRGQLSRIENARQEATLSTLAKILRSEKVSRKEFFRRYDLVEGEIQAARAGEPKTGAPGEGVPAPPNADLGAIQGFFGDFGAFFRSLLQQSGPIAQGAVEVGELTVLFQVVPRSSAAASVSPSPAPAPEPATGEADSDDDPEPPSGSEPPEPPRRRRGRPPGSKSGPRRLGPRPL
jgi:transcriptional regulator with XRE-family HTH domain